MTSVWGEAIASSTGITLPNPVELKLDCWLQLEAISLLSLTTKADLGQLSETSADPPQGLMLIKATLGAQPCFFLHTQSFSRGNHMLWITESSQKVNQGQSQASSDKGLNKTLWRPTNYIETNTKKQPKWEDKETDPKWKKIEFSRRRARLNGGKLFIR